MRWIALGSAAVWACAAVTLGAASLLKPHSTGEEHGKADAIPSVSVENSGHPETIAAHDPSSAPATDENPHSEGPQSVASEAPEIRSEDPTALRRVIDLYLQEGEYAKAVPFVDRAAASGQNDPVFQDQAARIYLAAGEFRKAEDMAAQGLKKDSSALEFWRVEAMALYRLGRTEEGMALGRKALARFPDQADLLVDLGVMEVEMGPTHPEYGKALARALELNPGSVPALYLLGRKHALEGNFGDAESAFRAVLRRDSTHAKAWAQLGIALYQEGKQEEAGLCMISALRHNPKDYNSWYNLGEWYARRLEAEADPAAGKTLRIKALQCYLHAVELNPDHVEAHFRVGVLMHGNGQFKEAIRHFQAAVGLDSTNAPAWFQMGVAYQRLELPEQARSCVRRAFALDPLNRLVIAKLRELS